MIPKEVYEEIVNRAKQSWPGDAEMQKHCISEESDAYKQLYEMDFGKYESLRDDFIKSAREECFDWEDCLSSVQSELSAYAALEQIAAEGIEASVLEAWKTEAARECNGFYGQQLEFVKEKISKHFSVIETREAIDPIKHLLIEIEKIIGSECYNDNIQNYSSWGELDSEGRAFRYPVKFYTDNGENKRWAVPANIPSEELITGYYAFGANELNIYRALYKVVEHLRKNYNLNV